MSEEKQATIVYALDPTTGAITRTDKAGQVETLATIKDGVLEYTSDETKRFHAAVVRFLNDEGVKFETIALKGAARDKVAVNIPPRPKMDPAKGDKTPAVVEWYRQYKPEEYKVKYGIVGEGTVIKTQTVTDPLTGRPKKIRTQHQATLSTRKIHLTEKLEANADGGDE
jgi:hypothetical protein